MTTYTLSGFSISYNQNDDPFAVGPATLQVVTPNNQAFLNYEVISTFDGLPEVELGGTEPQSVRINGADFPDNFFNEDYFGTITTNLGTHVMLGLYDATSATDYVFQVGGAPLTLPTNLTQLALLEQQIDSFGGFGIATGAFAPGQDILFSSLAGVQISNAGAPVNQIPGGPGNDQLFGTLDNDNITTGGGTDFVIGSVGNDTINMGANGGTDGYVDLDYSQVERGIDVTINGAAGTGSVSKADAGTDSLLGANAPMDAGAINGGLGIFGGMDDDSFALNVAGDQWMQVRGGDGVDSYTITGTGFVRLRFDGGIDAVSVNLGTGTVVNDGFGNTETISGRAWEVAGGFGNDTLIGSAADESFITGGGNNIVDGGAGFDRVRYDRFGVDGSVTIDLNAGTATGTWFGQSFTDSLTSIEWARGSNFNDTIIGSSADERFDGRGGVDSFTYNGGNDTISDFDFASETVTFDLGTPQTVQAALDAASSNGAGGVVVNFGGGNSLTFNNATVAQVQALNAAKTFNDIIGTPGSDDLIGTNGDDRFVTGDNDGSGDYIRPGLGNDLLDFSDVVTGFVTVDYGFLDGSQTIAVTIDGAANTGSVAYSGGDTDGMLNVANVLNAGFNVGGLEIRGTNGNDSFDVTPGSQQWMSLRMGDGVDALNVNGAGSVRLDFRDAIEAVEIDLAARTIANDGFGNAETIGGTASVFEVQGSAYDDMFLGDAGNNSYRYIGGNNTLDGGEGFDRLRYDRGTVASVDIDAEAGTVNGTLTAGGSFTDLIAGFERLRGSNGDDTIRGTSGDELLEGRGGANSFVYTGGNDTIGDFDIFRDTLTVRNGAMQTEVDAALAAAANDGAGNVVVDFGDGDTLTFGGLVAADVQTLIGNAGGRVPGIVAEATTAPSLVLGGAGDDTLNGAFNNDTLIGGDGNDVINGGFGFDSVDAGEGDDSVIGLNGFDTLDGGAGNDMLRGNAGNDVLYGGSGDDRLEGGIAFDLMYGGAGNDLLIAGDGFDTLEGDTGNDTLLGNAGNDLLYGGAGDDRLEGGIGADTLEGGAGDDLLRGGSGGDLLLGGDGDDRLEGNGGADRLDGGAGNDVLVGGIGADTFVFGLGYGADRIADFGIVDRVEIDAALLGGGAPEASDLIAYAGRDEDGFVVLDFGGGDTLTFTGITGLNVLLDRVDFLQPPTTDIVSEL